jgi:hypothetical protein
MERNPKCVGRGVWSSLSRALTPGGVRGQEPGAMVPVGIMRPIAVTFISLSLILDKAPAVGRSSKSKARASPQPCRSCQKHCEGNVYIRADMLPVFRAPMRSPTSGVTLLPRYRSMGIVTVTKSGRIRGGRRDWRHEAATRSPLPPPVPRRDHQLRCLAVPRV